MKGRGGFSRRGGGLCSAGPCVPMAARVDGAPDVAGAGVPWDGLVEAHGSGVVLAGDASRVWLVSMSISSAIGIAMLRVNVRDGGTCGPSFDIVNLSLLTVTGRFSAIPEHSAPEAPRWARAMKPAKQATVQQLKKYVP